MTTPSSPAYYPDAGDPSIERFWDGFAWTDLTRPAGWTPTDPFEETLNDILDPARDAEHEGWLRQRRRLLRTGFHVASVVVVAIGVYLLFHDALGWLTLFLPGHQ